MEGEPTLEDVVALASEYGVSAPAMVIRLEQCKLGSPERLARLRREVDEGLHGYLRVEPLGDRLERSSRRRCAARRRWIATAAAIARLMRRATLNSDPDGRVYDRLHARQRCGA